MNEEQTYYVTVNLTYQTTISVREGMLDDKDEIWDMAEEMLESDVDDGYVGSVDMEIVDEFIY